LMTIQVLLRAAQARLQDSPSPRLDAEVLLAHTLAVSRSYLYTWPERAVTAAQQAAYETLLQRRLAGVPVAYLTGQREFWSLTLAVTPATLIPRPDTELLVECGLAVLPSDRPVQALDLGTGSGAIALALALSRPAAWVLGIDNAWDALTVALHNRQQLGVTNLQYLAADWNATLITAPCFDVILSNPPYIAVADPHLTQGDVRYEPLSALVAGSDGLAALRQIIAGASRQLKRGGWLWLEHGYQQAAAVKELLAQHGYTSITSYADLAGQWRVSGGQWL
jgi:release factor glutamine methyltransferase